jgi:CspA family cold shock protein
MSKGKIKWYNEAKGFGFIETDEGKDIFVHRTGFKNTDFGIQPDQIVEFEIKQGDKGPVAINVVTVE